MVNHIVLWNFREEMSPDEREEAGRRIKELLEDVGRQVDGVISLTVIVNGKSSGNKDVGLISRFESEEALAAYQTHPAHVRAGEYIRSVTTGRSCLDY